MITGAKKYASFCWVQITCRFNSCKRKPQHAIVSHQHTDILLDSGNHPPRPTKQAMKNAGMCHNRETVKWVVSLRFPFQLAQKHTHPHTHTPHNIHTDTRTHLRLAHQCECYVAFRLRPLINTHMILTLSYEYDRSFCRILPRCGCFCRSRYIYIYIYIAHAMSRVRQLCSVGLGGAVLVASVPVLLFGFSPTGGV